MAVTLYKKGSLYALQMSEQNRNGLCEAEKMNKKLFFKYFFLFLQS